MIYLEFTCSDEKETALPKASGLFDEGDVFERVLYGRWIIKKRHTVSRNPYMDDNYYASATCSECDFCIHAENASFGYPKLNTTNYCPNCGAKMDKEE